MILKTLFRDVRALKDDGFPHPWRLLWISFRTHWLPHREHLWIDHDGTSYLDGVMPMRWVWRRRVLRSRPGSGGKKLAE
jgi:hypothetical protein